MISRRPTRWLAFSDLTVILGCFLVTLLAWAVWMRWGVGPHENYPVWRVTGLVLTLIAVGVPLVWGNWGASVTLAIPLGLAASAYYDWEKTDDSGLFVIGVVYLFVGSCLVVSVVAALAKAVAARYRADSDH